VRRVTLDDDGHAGDSASGTDTTVGPTLTATARMVAVSMGDEVGDARSTDGGLCGEGVFEQRTHHRVLALGRDARRGRPRARGGRRRGGG